MTVDSRKVLANLQELGRELEESSTTNAFGRPPSIATGVVALAAIRFYNIARALGDESPDGRPEEIAVAIERVATMLELSTANFVTAAMTGLRADLRSSSRTTASGPEADDRLDAERVPSSCVHHGDGDTNAVTQQA